MQKFFIFSYDRRARYFKSLSLSLSFHMDGDKSSQSYRTISSWKNLKESSRFLNVSFSFSTDSGKFPR